MKRTKIYLIQNPRKVASSSVNQLLLGEGSLLETGQSEVNLCYQDIETQKSVEKTVIPDHYDASVEESLTTVNTDKGFSRSSPDIPITAFVINLQNRPDRWREITSQFESVKSIKLERFNACSGNPGWKYCALSHLYIVQRAKDNNWPCVLVFEDDVLLENIESFDDYWASVFDWLMCNTDKWDVFNGGPAKGEVKKVIDSSQNMVQMSFSYGTHFMLYSSKAYDKVLNWTKWSTGGDFNPIDVYLSTSEFVHCATTPCLATQRAGFSNVVNNYYDPSSYSREVSEKIQGYLNRFSVRHLLFNTTHQTCKDPHNLTETVKKNQEQMIKVLGGKSNIHRMWSDEEIDQFMKEYFPEYYLETFTKLPSMIMKVDTVRYAWMYIHGGMYADCDIYYHKDVTSLFKEDAQVVFVTREWTWPSRNDITVSVHNCWFASAPGHKIWIDILDGIAENLKRGETNVFDLTGPNAISLIVSKNLSKYASQEIQILPGSVIFQRGMSKHNGKDSYLEHQCHGSWKVETEKSLTHSKVPEKLKEQMEDNYSENERKTVFTRIYDKHYWGTEGQGSGPGSALSKTSGTRDLMTRIFKKYGWKSIMDAPCGGMEWQFGWLNSSTDDLPNLKYYGIDIVDSVIAKNIANISSKLIDTRHEIEFSVCDITSSLFPKHDVDVILCRDTLQHLPLKDVDLALKNIAFSGAKFALIGSYPTRNGLNTNIPVGGYFPIDLAREPFRLPEPIEILEENNADKFLYLFSTEDLRKMYTMNGETFLHLPA